MVVLAQSLAACSAPSLPLPASGVASFQDSTPGHDGLIDDVQLSVASLQPPQEGMEYTGWLVDKERAVFLRLGQLVPVSDATGGTWTLQYKSKAAGPSLLFSGEKRLLEVLVTMEPVGGPDTTPGGTTVLAGQFPEAPFYHVQHLLVGHPVTDPPGHIIRLLRQAQILVEEPLAQLFLAIDGVYPQWEAACAAQSILDMVEGKSGGAYRPLPTACTYAHFPVTQVGDGYGIDNHLKDVLAHVVSAEDSPGVTSTMSAGAVDVQGDATNLKDWYSAVATYALEIVHGSNVHVRDLRALCEDALQGDLDSKQGGIYQAYAAAQSMATLRLTVPK
jgi:hypothetical protein